MKHPNKKVFLYTLSFLITLISVGILIHLLSQNLDALEAIREDFTPGPLLITIPLFGIGEWIASLAWARIMNDIAQPLPTIQHQQIFIITHATRRLPGTVWHILGRIAWYEKLGISKSLTALANVFETILIFWSALIIAFVSLPFIVWSNNQPSWPFVIGLCLSTIIMHPKTLKLIFRLFKQPRVADQISYKTIIIWLSFYLLLWLNNGTILYLVINSLSKFSVSLWPLCVLTMCISGIIGTIVLFVPSGLGLSEATTSLMLSTHLPSSIAVAAAIVIRISLTALEFFFAGIALLWWLRQSSNQFPPKHSP